MGKFRECTRNQLEMALEKVFRSEEKETWPGHLKLTMVLIRLFLSHATTSQQDFLFTSDPEVVPKGDSNDDPRSLTLSGYGSSPALTVKLCAKSNLPFGVTWPDNPHPTGFIASKDKKNVLPKTRNYLLSASQTSTSLNPKRNFFGLGHIGMKRVQ